MKNIFVFTLLILLIAGCVSESSYFPSETDKWNRVKQLKDLRYTFEYAVFNKLSNKKLNDCTNILADNILPSKEFTIYNVDQDCFILEKFVEIRTNYSLDLKDRDERFYSYSCADFDRRDMIIIYVNDSNLISPEYLHEPVIDYNEKILSFYKTEKSGTNFPQFRIEYVDDEEVLSRNLFVLIDVKIPSDKKQKVKFFHDLIFLTKRILLTYDNAKNITSFQRFNIPYNFTGKKQKEIINTVVKSGIVIQFHQSAT